MKSRLLTLALVLAWGGCAGARAGDNLLSNPGFDGPDPLAGWRIDFPHEARYVLNGDRVRVSRENGRGGNCILIDLPRGVAGVEGGKVETAFVPCVAGARYVAEVECMTWDLNAKLMVEIYARDPRPEPKPDKFCVPAEGDRPALVTIQRIQLPDPPGKSRRWDKAGREFDVFPAGKAKVLGKGATPEYMVLKAFAYAGTMEPARAYFDNFRLARVR